MKVGELMLQYPTNVYPENIAFDSTVLDSNNTISFKFNGDILTGALYHVFDYNTGELVLTKGHVYQLRTPIVYNGQELKMADGFLNDLDNGKDYAMQIMVLQWQSDGTAPLCDMFVLRGQTQENYLTTDDTTITIEDKISSIYEWEQTTSEGWRNNSVWAGVVVTSCELVIGEERRHIVAYQETTGKAVLSSALPSNIPAGTKYQIYCNYKVSPLYFFKCRQTPTVDLQLSYDHITNTYWGFKVDGNYSQEQNSLINYYSIELLYARTETGTPWTKIDETEKIYSQKIEFNFYDDFVLGSHSIAPVEFHVWTDVYYKAIIKIVTVDGMTIKNESNILHMDSLSTSITTTVDFALWDEDKADTFYKDTANMVKHGVESKWHSSTGNPIPDTFYRRYRVNMRTGEVVTVHDEIDLTVPTKGKFRYYVVPQDRTTGKFYLDAIGYADIDVTMRGYTITELKLMGDNYQWGTKPRYHIGDQWKFVGDIQDTTVTQNMDKYLHINYGTYPSLTRTNTKYMSGTLSAMSGYVNCTTKQYVDDIDIIRAWRDFITRPCIYMLKSQKGDVWIVNITESPATTYQENLKEIPTTFTFDWVECCDVNDIEIYYEPHSTNDI